MFLIGTFHRLCGMALVCLALSAGMASAMAGYVGKTPNDVYNLVEIIKAELMTLKGRFGLDKVAAPVEESSGIKSPSHVFQMMNYIHLHLSDILALEHQGGTQP